MRGRNIDSCAASRRPTIVIQMARAKPIRLETADLDRTAKTLLAVVGEVARELHAGNAALPTLRLDSSLADDFALDSLARVELGGRIERTFDLALSEAALFDADTPRDLLRAVLRAAGSAPLKAPAVIVDVQTGQAQAAPADVETLSELLAWHVGEHGDRPAHSILRRLHGWRDSDLPRFCGTVRPPSLPDCRAVDWSRGRPSP